MKKVSLISNSKEMSIFQVKDLESELIRILEIEDLASLYRINKYYHSKSKENILISEYKLCRRGKKNFNFNTACETGTLNLVKYLLMNRIKSGTTIICGFTTSCMYGKLEAAMYLYAYILDKNVRMPELTLRIALEKSCTMGQKNTAEWILSLDSKLEQHHVMDHIFTLACGYGHIEICQWLYAKYHIDLQHKSCEAFTISCTQGHLGLAKWLHARYTEELIIPYYGYAFDGSCAKNQIEVAEWILDECPYLIDVSTAFATACESGNLTTAKWLYSLGKVDIHVMNNYLFKKMEGETLAWLNTLL